MRVEKPTLEQIISEVIPIPGSHWGLHPAFPVLLGRRSVKAQRASPLRLLKKKAGSFDIDRVGLPEGIPNGVQVDFVVGATRLEWAQEAGVQTIPVKIWIGENPGVSGHADRFLNEQESVKPGTNTAHNIAKLAGRRAALLVDQVSGKFTTRSVAAIYSILGARPTGADQAIPRETAALLHKTAELISHAKPDVDEVCPGVVIGAVAHLAAKGHTIARKWHKLPWSLAVERGRNRKIHFGGKGNLVEHVAHVLDGGEYVAPREPRARGRPAKSRAEARA